MPDYKDTAKALVDIWNADGRQIDLKNPETLKGIYTITSGDGSRPPKAVELSEIAELIKTKDVCGYNSMYWCNSIESFLHEQSTLGKLYTIDGPDKKPTYYAIDHTKAPRRGMAVPILKCTDQKQVPLEPREKAPWYARSKIGLWFGTLFKTTVEKGARTTAYERYHASLARRNKEDDLNNKLVQGHIEQLKASENKIAQPEAKKEAVNEALEQEKGVINQVVQSMEQPQPENTQNKQIRRSSVHKPGMVFNNNDDKMIFVKDCTANLARSFRTVFSKNPDNIHKIPLF